MTQVIIISSSHYRWSPIDHVNHTSLLAILTCWSRPNRVFIRSVRSEQRMIRNRQQTTPLFIWIAWCYRIIFGLTVLKFDDFLSGILLLKHAVTLSICTKETAYTGPELYFSLSVLLMYGTNCLSQLILDRFLCSCTVSAVWIYLILHV